MAGLTASNFLLEKKKSDVGALLLGAVSIRLTHALTDPASKFLAVDAQAARFTRTMKYFEISISCNGGEELVAFERVLTEMERIKTFGISKSELQQLVRFMDTYVSSIKKQKLMSTNIL